MTVSNTIRLATETDVAGLACLEARAFADAPQSAWSEASLRSALAGHAASNHRAVLVEGDAHPLTYALFRRAHTEAELLRVATDPAARRRGLARRLLAEALDRLRGEGVTEVHLEVREDNEPALALYRDLDFLPVGRRPGYYRSGGTRRDALLFHRRMASQGRRDRLEGPGGGCYAPHST